jgi:GntR family transcriptional regulator, transcriptional repressor for pyruvate dehydrogenase complex
MKHEITSIGSLLKPLPAKRVFEEMADQIKDLIFSGKLIPGNRLPTERDLAVQFGTGRMAVREALRILEQSGLIQIKKGPGGGAFVRDVDPAMVSQSVSDAIVRSNMSLHDLVAVRIVLEDLIAELAVEKITREELEQLYRVIEEAEGILEESGKKQGGELDTELMREVNVDFHLLLARATKNMLLEINIESLQQSLHAHFKSKTKNLEFFEWHLSQHKNILDAIQSKKVKQAKRLMKDHAMSLQKKLSEFDDEILS